MCVMVDIMPHRLERPTPAPPYRASSSAGRRQGTPEQYPLKGPWLAPQATPIVASATALSLICGGAAYAATEATVPRASDVIPSTSTSDAQRTTGTDTRYAERLFSCEDGVMESQMPIFDSGGTPIYYESVGEGPPLLLIHAISAGAGMWEPQVERFAASHQVITLDVRGVGRSGPIRRWRGIREAMAGDAIALLDHLEVEFASICGVSFGGVIAQHVATRYPARVARLVIADSYSDTRPTTVSKAAWLASVYAGSVSNLLPNRTLRRVIESQYRRWPLAAEHLGEAVSRLRGVEALKTRLAINLVHYLPELERARFPILAIVGESSWPRSMRFATELVRAVPRTKLVRLHDSNDPSSLCQPEAFNAALESFLDLPASEARS